MCYTYLCEGRYHECLPWMKLAEQKQPPCGINVSANLSGLVRNWRRRDAASPVGPRTLTGMA